MNLSPGLKPVQPTALPIRVVGTEQCSFEGVTCLQSRFSSICCLFRLRVLWPTVLMPPVVDNAFHRKSGSVMNSDAEVCDVDKL